MIIPVQNYFSHVQLDVLTYVCGFNIGQMISKEDILSDDRLAQNSERTRIRNNIKFRTSSSLP